MKLLLKERKPGTYSTYYRVEAEGEDIAAALTAVLSAAEREARDRAKKGRVKPKR